MICVYLLGWTWTPTLPTEMFSLVAVRARMAQGSGPPTSVCITATWRACLFRRRPRGTTCKASGLAGLHSSRFPDGVDAAALRTTRLWQSATLTLQWVSIIKAYFWGRQGPHRRWNPSKTLFSMGDSAVAWLHYQEHVASLLGGRKQWRCSPHQLHALAREWLLITTCWPRLVTWPQWKVVGSPSGGDAICAWKELRPSCG